MAFLTIDLGNSRLKAARFAVGRGEPEVTDALELPLDERLESDLAAWLGGLAPCAGGFLATVAGPAAGEAVQRAARATLGAPLAEPDAGLENRCREPERVGVDRLFAARAAIELTGVPTVVCDAGTALTVDLVRPPEPGAGGEAVARGFSGRFAGRFIGGAIAPGPALLARALGAGGARLPSVAPRPGAPALGRVTEAAIEGGVAVGFRGAAAALVEAVAAEGGHPDAPVVLGGGARGFLLDPPFTPRRLTVVPSLVLRGLLAAGRGMRPTARR